jgi:plastocyanin
VGPTSPPAAPLGPTSPPGGVPPSAPTPTAEPFVQRVVSRVARQTQAPFPTSTPLPNGAALVSIVDFGYMPGTIRIHAGQTVVWRNDGREEHDVTGDDWHSGPMEPTIEYRQTFGSPGTVLKYRCSIHPDMTGIIIIQ